MLQFSKKSREKEVGFFDRKGTGREKERNRQFWFGFWVLKKEREGKISNGETKGEERTERLVLEGFVWKGI